MEIESPTEDQMKKPVNIMEEEYSATQQPRKDLFEYFLGTLDMQESSDNNRLQIRRSDKKVLERSDFRNILNTSSSNEKLIPSLKNDSSRQHSQRGHNNFQTQNSFDQQSFRQSFRKRYQESFSIENTIRDSSSEFSERSDSKSYRNIIPSVYKEQIDLQPVEKKIICNCKRSKCLKLYCQCFQRQLFCNELCNCHDCGNISENQQNHKQAIIEALARNVHSFQENQINAQTLKSFSLGVELQEVKRGCKCRRTHCIKKYCECYQNQSQCGIFCRCEDCFNTTYHKDQK